MPSRKWYATQVTALTGWAIALINVSGHWTPTIKIALVTIIGQAAIGWLIPNDGNDLLASPRGSARRSLYLSGRPGPYSEER